MKNIKNKGTLFAILIVGILGIVGGTYAYFSSSDSLDNLFNSKSYVLQAVEQFKSPEGWAPGDTTTKNVTVTNTGDIGAAVRIEVVEEWKDASNNTLPLTYDSDNNLAAIINFNPDLEDHWIKAVENGHTYYYYKDKLSSGETTASLLNSVTFNPDITKSFNDSCTEDSNTHTKICNSTATGYIGGTYTLTLNIDTVQFEQYMDAWNTRVRIGGMGPRITIISGDLNTVGSEVALESEHFYVIGQEDATHVKLFAKYNLGVGTNFDPETNIQDPTALGEVYNAPSPTKGCVVYAVGTDWASGFSSYPTYGYSNEKINGEYRQSIAQYVENYVDILDSMGFSVTARLISKQEILDLINNGNNISNANAFSQYASNYTGKEWLSTTTYWTGTAYSSYNVYTVSNNSYGGYFQNRAIDISYSFGVRPVIIIEKPSA